MKRRRSGTESPGNLPCSLTEGASEWVGATEVGTLLHYMYVRAVLIINTDPGHLSHTATGPTSAIFDKLAPKH
jgi:hypothetical protein